MAFVGGGPPESTPDPGEVGAGTPGGVSTPSAPGQRQQGGGGKDPGSVNSLQLPQPGQLDIHRESQIAFRAIWSRWEGLNQKSAPTEVGELQAQMLTNLLTDEVSLRKRTGSTDVSTSGSNSHVGLHEVSQLRELTLQVCDDQSQWTESDAVNWVATDETTIKLEGTGSIQMDATGAGSEGDTILHDLGAGSTKDLSVFDYVEVMMQGTLSGGDQVFFGISEDNISYTEVAFTGSDNWRTLRLDITGLAAASRNAIRYLRFRYDDTSGTARTIYADLIRAVRRAQHLIRARVANGTATGGVRDIPANIDIAIEENSSGTWTTLTTVTAPANTKVRFVDWFGVTYIMAGEAGAWKFENGALAVWTDPPPSRFIEQHYEKLWALSPLHDSSALRHTDSGSVSVWPTSSSPVKRGAGGTIYVGRRYAYFPTGIKSAFGQLFLFTEGDLWILFGTDNSSFNLQRAHPGAGTLSHESVARYDTGMFWHDGLSNRVLWYKGGGIADISDPIRPILEAIPAALKPWTAGLWDGRNYLLSYARSGEENNDRCVLFDSLTSRWHGPYTGDWVGFNAALVAANGTKYSASADAQGVHAILGSATSDNGDAISIAWKSSAQRFRLPRWTKRIRRLWAMCESTSATLTVNVYRDGEASPGHTYTLTFTGSPIETQSSGVDFDCRGNSLEFEITESSTSAVNILEFGVDAQMIRALR